MKKIVISTLVLASVIAHSAYASEQRWNYHEGWYVNANVGTNFYYTAVVSSDYHGSSKGINGYGWNANGGYSFNHYVAAEAGLLQSYLISADSTNHFIVSAPYAAAKFTAPLGKQFALFGKVGGMYAFNNHDGIALPFIGVGASYAVSPKVDIDATYQGAVYGIIGAGLLSGGVTYHFN